MELHGTILDGTGAPAFAGTVSVRGDRIASVVPDPAPERRAAGSGEAIELGTLVLAPGFIDIHSHGDHFLLVDPGAASKVRQGVTTDVIGNCGYSAAPLSPALAARRARGLEPFDLRPDWTSMRSYLDRLADAGPALNVAALAGHATLRAQCGIPDDRAADAAERAALARATEAVLAEGAFGITTGVFYAPGRHADAAELRALLEPVRGSNRLYAAHIRDEGEGVVAALAEALGTATDAGVRFQYSHIKAWGRENWKHRRRIVRLLEEARARGLDMATDLYPYTSAATDLAAGLGLSGERRPEALAQAVRTRVARDPSWPSRVRILASLAPGASGRRLDEFPDPAAAVVAILAADPRTAAAFEELSEANMRAFLALPYAAIGSDASNRDVAGPLGGGRVHPRAFGTFPRVLGRYVRERGLLGLEDAVRRMTSLPASRLGLSDRGRIAAGLCADLVAFDPATVADAATFRTPCRFPKGIVHAWVNGVAVLRDGAQTAERPGRVLRP